MPTNPLFEKARVCLEAGEESKARDCVQRAVGMDIRSSVLCVAWAEMCEELGLARLGREFYERALRVSPDHTGALFGLASLTAEGGHLEKSVRHLKKVLKLQPDHSRARALLARHYHELGLPGQAAFLEPPGAGHSEASPLRFFKPSVSDRDTHCLLSLFAGRETGFAVQELCSTTGESRHVFQEGILTRELIKAHIDGETTLALYPLRSDHTVSHAALSVRIAGNMLQKDRGNTSSRILFQEKMCRHLLTLAGQAGRSKLPAYAEETGAGPGRLWFFFDGFIHFLKAKRFLQDFLEQATPAESPLVVEPLLPTKPVGIGWVEQAIALPLGLDRATLRRSFFLDSEGRAVGEQLKFIHRIRRIPPHSLKNAANPPMIRRGNEAGTLDNLGHKWMKRLMERCPVLAEVVKTAMSGRMLRRDEKVVLFYTLGLLDRGEELLHEVLYTTPDYQFESVRRQASRLKGNPMSCVRIRQLIPEITVASPCQCDFDLRGGKYPSPLLHVHPHLVPISEVFATPSDLSLKEAAQRYSGLLQHAEETRRALQRLEEILETGFQKRKLTRIRLDRHELVRVETGDGVRWKLEFA